MFYHKCSECPYFNVCDADGERISCIDVQCRDNVDYWNEKVGDENEDDN